MIRSMSDAQIEAAEVARHGVGFDKEPWWSRQTGNRYANDVPGLQLIFAPRPECIPSPDPFSWKYRSGDARGSMQFGGMMRLLPRAWGTFTPDPEFVRSEVNPILAEFRRSAPWNIAEAARIEVDWLRKPGHPVPANATQAQIDEAVKVLSRLRDVMGAVK